MIGLGRRRCPRVHVIEQDTAGRTVRDACCAAGREDSLSPVLVLARTCPGGHHERHPLAANSNGPPLTRKATLEAYTVALSPQDLPPGCFTPPPGGWFRMPPWYRTPPQGCLDAPPGVVAKPLRAWNHPRVLAALPRGWRVVRTRGRRCRQPCRCGARPPARPAAASGADTTTARSRP